MKLKKANTLLKEENLENLDLEPSNSVGPKRSRVTDDSSPSSPSPSPSPPRRKLNTHLRFVDGGNEVIISPNGFNSHTKFNVNDDVNDVNGDNSYKTGWMTRLSYDN
jgi:hypothetical protein